MNMTETFYLLPGGPVTNFEQMESQMAVTQDHVMLSESQNLELNDSNRLINESNQDQINLSKQEASLPKDKNEQELPLHSDEPNVIQKEQTQPALMLSLPSLEDNEQELPTEQQQVLPLPSFETTSSLIMERRSLNENLSRHQCQQQNEEHNQFAEEHSFITQTTINVDNTETGDQDMLVDVTDNTGSVVLIEQQAEHVQQENEVKLEMENVSSQQHVIDGEVEENNPCKNEQTFVNEKTEQTEEDELMLQTDVNKDNAVVESLSYVNVQEVTDATVAMNEMDYHVVINDTEVADVNGLAEHLVVQSENPSSSSEIGEMIELHIDNGNIESNSSAQVDADIHKISENESTLILPDMLSPDEQSLIDSDHTTIIDLGEAHESLQEVYVVESVDDVIVDVVVQNIDQPETMNIIDLPVDGTVEIDSKTNKKRSAANKNKPKIPTNIPSHVLGRNVENPSIDALRNGRVGPKPRLGVKIPYRNLTSQIVSKEEIANEIMERSRLRNSNTEVPEGGDVFFAKKLTQRLARKLAPGSTHFKTEHESTITMQQSSNVVASTASTSKTTIYDANDNSSKKSENQPKAAAIKPVETNIENKIKENCDLIAILEGDGDIEWPEVKSKTISPMKSSLAKGHSEKEIDIDLEKEVALQQLRELPFLPKYKKHPARTSEFLNKSVSKPTSKPIYAPEKKVAPEKKAMPEKKVEPEKKITPDKKLTPQVKTEVKVELSDAPNKSKTLSENKTIIHVISDKIVKTADKTAASQVHITKPKVVTSSTSKEDAIIPEPRFSSKTVLKTYTRKRKPSDEILASFIHPVQIVKKSAVSVADEIQTPASINLAPNTYISKSSRVIKRKVIWDPDEATPVNKVKPIKPVDTFKNTSAEKLKVVKSSEAPKIESAEKPKVSKPVAETPNVVPSEKLKLVKTSGTFSSSDKPKVIKLIQGTKKDSIEKLRSHASKQMLRRPGKILLKRKTGILKPLTKTLKKTLFKKKKPKRLSEVDRLLMDEGAVNMLYAVKNIEDNLSVIKQKKTKATISIDRAHRELINKTNEIKNDLQSSIGSKESPKTLRKKEGVILKSIVKDVVPGAVLRKKSRESLTSSVHSPPASPAFPYSQHAEASRIIRRHSSSSFSSLDSDVDTSGERKVVTTVEINATEAKQPKVIGETGKIVKQKTRASLDAAEGPKTKKTRQSSNKVRLRAQASIDAVEDAKEAATLSDSKTSNDELSKKFNKSVADDDLNIETIETESKYSQFKTFKVRTFDCLVQLILTPALNGQTTLSSEFFKEIITVLGILKKDSECHAVLMCSSGNSFCQGIDYKSLVVTNDEHRKKLSGLTVRVKNFLSCIAKFPKLLAAGVHGPTVGLGVTMLPLFDMVWASDSATFFAPYAQLGCAAEGGAVLTLPHLMNNSLVSELLFASRKLTASEALRLGLVTRTLWPDRFQDELINSLKAISNQSIQSMVATKKQLRNHWLSQVDRLLSTETDTLIQHWLSPECQINFSNYSVEEV